MSSLSRRLGLAIAGVLALSTPALAGWGGASPWTFVGETNYCKYGSSGNSNYRKVRLQVLDITIPICLEGQLCFDWWLGQDAVVTNQTPSGKSNSGRADIFLTGFNQSSSSAPWILYFGRYNDLARNASGSLATSNATNFTRVQASCQTSDQML